MLINVNLMLFFPSAHPTNPFVAPGVVPAAAPTNPFQCNGRAATVAAAAGLFLLAVSVCFENHLTHLTPCLLT